MQPGFDACLKRRGLSLLMALVLGGCSHPAFREGLAAMSLGKKEEGINSLEKAVRDEPRNAEMKASLIRHRGETIDGYLAEAERQRAAGQPEAAALAYRQVLALDAGNARARQGMEQLVADRRNG